MSKDDKFITYDKKVFSINRQLSPYIKVRVLLDKLIVQIFNLLIGHLDLNYQKSIEFPLQFLLL